MHVPRSVDKRPYSTVSSKSPPAKPGALGCEPLKAAEGAAEAAPDRVGHLKVAHQRHRFICSRRLSSSSCFLMYSRITSVSRPTGIHLPDADAVLDTRSSCGTLE